MTAKDQSAEREAFEEMWSMAMGDNWVNRADEDTPGDQLTYCSRRTRDARWGWQSAMLYAARAALSAREAPASDAYKASLWLINVRDEFRKLAEEANTIMRGHIELLNAAPAREGWQLVPKEPTYEMLKAGDAEADPPRTAEPHRIPLPAMYRAMLAAAPQPTTEGSEK